MPSLKEFTYFRISTNYFRMDLPLVVPKFRHNKKSLLPLSKIHLNPTSIKYQTIHRNVKYLKRESDQGKTNKTLTGQEHKKRKNNYKENRFP